MSADYSDPELRRCFPWLTGRVVLESCLVVLLFLLASTFAVSRYNPYPKDWSQGTFYEKYYSAAVMSACGYGLLRPAAVSPDLDDFLKLRVMDFSCDKLQEGAKTLPPSGQSVANQYLQRTIALIWSWWGISWPALDLLIGLFFGFVVITSYALFRLARATIKRCVNSRGGEYPSGLT